MKYIEDLEELGYCVIPNIFSAEETKTLYHRVWTEFIEKAWPKCQMNNRENWNEEFPIQDKYGIFKGPAGQIQVMWDLRQDERIINIFKQIWNTENLVVSMDGLSFMCPVEIRQGNFEPWPHVDQYEINLTGESSLKTNPYNIQGQFLFEDSFEGDGGFYCIPYSHLKFDKFISKLKKEFNKESYLHNNTFLIDYFKDFPKKHVMAPRGSLILWDSRTVHWNQCADINRSLVEFPKVRMVGYLLYLPEKRLTDESRKLRKEAFENGATTGAIPLFHSDLNYSKNFVNSNYVRYLEDSNFALPEIKLTELGKSLLGF